MSKFTEFTTAQQYMIETMVMHNEEIMRLSEQVRDTADAADQMIKMGRPGGVHVNANAALALVEETAKRAQLVQVMLHGSGLNRKVIEDVMSMNRNEFFAAYMC